MPASPVRRILIAPLDWGLGHTTRCVPIIRRLIDAKREVVFAGNDAQKTFIAATFPGIRCLDLPGYGVKYSAGRFLPNILRQIPKILSRIHLEHRWLLRIVEQEGIGAVISDNRYGLWHPRIPSVILTHQASPITGLGSKADAWLRSLHYRMLARFGEVWLVDMPGWPNLSGKLAHPPALPRNARYIGLLSQLLRTGPVADHKYVLILLSGPEPQRTILADLVWHQACALPDRQFVFVEGRADADRQPVPPHIRHYPRATTGELQQLLAGASIVVCRSGYSSLMDLALFGKRAVLIPTPGQTEQEYLAWKLEVDGIFLKYLQRRFDLRTALEIMADLRHWSASIPADFQLFETVLDAWLAAVEAGRP